MNEEQLIQDLAQGIVKRGMEAPAIFALEMYKPMAGVLYNFSIAVFPMLSAVLGLEKFKEAIQLMKSPELIEKLIISLEKTKV